MSDANGKNDEYWKWNASPNCKCVVCGKEMYVRPNRLKKSKHGVTCSLECSSKNRSKWFRGEGNHQYGLKEELNSSFKSKRRISNYGYVLVHMKDHPFCDCQGMVKEHRLVIEENADLFDDKFFTVINGKKYLKKEYEVHHINEIKTDNRIENLAVVTKSEHRAIHNEQHQIIRKRNGKISAFIKKGESIPIGIKLYNGGKVPVRKTAGAACYDCFANETACIPSGGRSKIGLGFGLELPYMFEAVIRPRSGLTLKGIDSAIGTIDEDFKSEISAIVINNSDSDFKVNIGDRICQMAIRQYERYEFEIVDELSETVRGEGGFGSTGV